jgi:hypothetical protein
MIEEVFQPKDPRTAQYSMSVEEFVSICAPLKLAFIHHPTTLKLLKTVVEELGCGLDDPYIDVPRLRMVTHGGYFDLRCRLRAPSAPRCLVLRSNVPAELVASDLSL